MNVLFFTQLHDCLYISICKSTGWNPVMEPQRVISLIVALLSLIIAIRKTQRLRFLALCFLYERRHRHIAHALLVTKIEGLQHRQRKASARRRCVVWSYPRPQGWFEEMYRNPDMSTLWKNHFRVSKDTFGYICQLVGPELSRQNTCLRGAIPLAKHVGIALWRLETRNWYRTTGITFGQGKSTVIKICENFMEALIRRKNKFIQFPRCCTCYA